MKTKNLPLWKLERYLLGELTPGEMETLSNLIRENPEMNQEIEQMKQFNREILRQNPPAAFVPQIAERYKKEKLQQMKRQTERRRNWKRWLIASPLLATTLIVMVILFNEKPQNRIKGNEAMNTAISQIVIYKKTNLGIVTLRNGDQVNPGDLLQLAYISTWKKFGVLLSVDGNHVINLHYPKQKTSSSRLMQGGKVLLPTAYELDAAPQYECFYFITAMEEININKMMDLIATISRRPDFPQKKDIELPAAYSQFCFLLKKGDSK